MDMHKRMYKSPVTLITGLCTLLLGSANANQTSENGLLTMSVEQATSQVKQACPKVWDQVSSYLFE